jgi:photosystem II stability/assembly factor-like uncharacterized protein
MKRLLQALTILLITASGATAQVGWFDQSTGDDTVLFGVEMLDASIAVAVGPDGVILRTTDGGSSWKLVPSGTQQVLRRIRFHSPTLAVITANEGEMLKSTDAGATWSPLQTGTTKGLYDVHFFDENRWIAIGQGAYITETTDGGVTWTQKASGTNNWNEVAFRGSLGLMAGNKGDINVTTNGGTSWTKRSSPDDLELRSVSIGDDSTAVMSGINGTLIKTTNKGRHWKLVYASIPMASNRVSSVRHLTRDHVVAVAYGGVIIESRNAGETWDPQNSNTGENLESLSFIDSKIGTAVGWRGTIIRTNNGGTMSVRQDGAALASGLSILEQYPLPLRRDAGASGILRLNVEQAGPVSITAMDVLGRSKALLFDGYLVEGSHSVSLQPSGLNPGLYLLHIAQGSRGITGKIIIE